MNLPSGLTAPRSRSVTSIRPTRAVELAPGERPQILVPLVAETGGEAMLTVALTIPGGEVLW
jgi:hypothetical protein